MQRGRRKPNRVRQQVSAGDRPSHSRLVRVLGFVQARHMISIRASTSTHVGYRYDEVCLKAEGVRVALHYGLWPMNGVLKRGHLGLSARSKAGRNTESVGTGDT
eukprot:scaffold9174_cov18-Prasinocladus_malaysianus.AAC.2